MPSKDTGFLDSVPTVEKVKKIASDRRLNRRNFMAALGMTGAAAGASLITGCSDDNTAPVAPPTLGATDVLNFALNLEFLEATFYSYVVKGADLPSTVLNNSGAVTGAPAAAITFTGTAAAQITDVLNEIYYDELNHVRDLLTIVGSSAIARPAINLAALGPITSTNVLSIARLFEDVGATAYAGASSLLSGTTLGIAAQILAVEGFHAGALRLLSIQNPTLSAYISADARDVKPADPGTAALAAAGPSANGAFFATAGSASATAAVPAGFAFTRTTSQVLAIVYANAAAGTTSGGFFPNGVNGAIHTV